MNVQVYTAEVGRKSSQYWDILWIIYDAKDDTPGGDPGGWAGKAKVSHRTVA